jgi:phage gp36-like protein
MYCTVDDVRGALTRDPEDTVGTAASMDDDQLTACIVDGQNEVDSRLGVRYDVPFVDDSVPSAVNQITRDIAAYLATLTYRQTLDLTDQDPVVLRYNRSMALLIAISKGQANLDVPTGETEPTVSGIMQGVARPSGSLFPAAEFGLGLRRF